jgi:hypothetical protein
MLKNNNFSPGKTAGQLKIGRHALFYWMLCLNISAAGGEENKTVPAGKEIVQL